MGKYSLAPGVRFHPTDVELVMYYLKRKVLGKKLAFRAIAEVDIYKHDPLDLPDMSCLKTRDLKWFFYCPVEKKYARGTRVNRATVYGYWKTTGKDRPVEYNEEVVGMIKSLVFHRGKAPCGERTDWVMHEYRLAEKKLADRGIVQDTYVLCAVFKKDGVGSKNGAQYGAPFKEEGWSDDEDANLLGTGSSDDSSGLYTQRLVLDANATVIDTAGIVNHGYAAPTGSVDEDANLLGTGPSDDLSGLYTQPLVLDATATVIDTAGIVNHGYAAPTGSVDEDANLPVTYSLSSMSTLAVSGASSSCVPESQSLGLSVESNGLSTLPQVVHADAIVSITADIHSSNYAAYTCLGAPQVPVVADGKAVPVLLEAPQFALAPKVEESNGSISSMLDLFTVEDAFTTYDRGQMTGNADDSFCSAPQVSDDDDILSMLAYFDEDNNLNNLLYPYEYDVTIK